MHTDSSGGPVTAASDAADGLLPRDLGTLRQLWRFRGYGRAELRSLLSGVVMRACELAADLAAPWPLALVIDNLLRGRSRNDPLHRVAGWFGGSAVAMLTIAAVAGLLFTVASGLFDYLGDKFMNGAGQRITSHIRSDVFAHLERLPMGYHDLQAVGELTSRVVTDTERIDHSLVDLFSTLVPGVLALVGTAAVLISVDWRLGLITLCAAPLVFLTAVRYARLTRRNSRRLRGAEGSLTGFVTESLQGIRTVHAFGSQELQDRRFGRTNNKVLKIGLRGVDLSARFTPALESVSAIGTAVLLFVGGDGVLHDWWSVGLLVVVTNYLNNMLKPMKTLAKLLPSFTQGAASAERIAAILDQPREHVGSARGLPERVTGELDLRDVGLDYGRGPVLNGLDLTIHAGERIALLGDNGAGKSTTLSLIGGLYRPTSGQVLLDGFSVPDVPEHWLHQQVAMVLQDTFLFSGTLADNLRHGRPEASDAEVARVAEAALVTEFADQLPDGLNTTIAAGGVGLSGGQRQRVGIARALLVDAPVVLLDEPTAGLDVTAEELVVQALTRLVEGRTVIMTTHQPTLTRLATRTVYLRPGGILHDTPTRPPHTTSAPTPNQAEARRTAEALPNQSPRPDTPPDNDPAIPVIMVNGHDERSEPERSSAPQGAGRVPGPRNAEGAAGEVVLAALRSQVEQLRVQDQRVRHKVAGSVTRMRVATRRLRSTLRGFSPILDPEHTRVPANELKWLSAQLATERDTQVMVERFTHVVRELPDDLILGTVAADPGHALSQLVEEGEQTVQAALDSGRYLALQDMLEQLLNQPPLTHRAGQPALAELPRSVAKALRKLDRLLDAADLLPPGPDRDNTLHEARKACKRVRYMTEVVVPVVGKPARDLHRQTEKLQELLGNYQDAVEARPVLRQLAEAAHADGHNAFTYGLLYAIEHARMEQVLRDLPHRLERLHDEKTLSWLQPPPAPLRLTSAISGR
jgi:ABC-type multidrug transport system fused ATPase/permease subunit/CHAD domain-containing protein